MLTLISTSNDDEAVTHEYTCDFTVTLAGDSLWDCKDTAVQVTAIVTNEAEDWNSVSVTHTGKWQVYTDTGFERAISAALGRSVQFTEQGMQEDNFASMEFAE